MKKIAPLLLITTLLLQLILDIKPVQAATINFCGQKLTTTINGQTKSLILHCNTTYALFFFDPANQPNGRWMSLQNATVDYIYPYITFTYNGIPWKVVGTVTGWDTYTNSPSPCFCTTFSPPATPVAATKTNTPVVKTNTPVKATSTFGWYTLTPVNPTPTYWTRTPTYFTLTPSRTFTQTMTPTPIVDLNKARETINQKRTIIREIESVKIKTNLIDIPLPVMIDESAAKALVNDLERMVNDKTLSPEKWKAFQRLVMQEQVFLDMLPIYANTASQVAKPMADMSKVLAGYKMVLNKALGLCKSSLCDYPKERLLDLVLRVERNFQTDLIRLIPKKIFPSETAAKILDAWIRIARTRLDKGYAITELLMDTAVEYAIAGVFTEVYAFNAQQELDKGVQTVRVAPSRGALPITGTAERAQLMLDQLVQKAQWAEQSAEERYQDFNRAARIADTVQDLASVIGFNIIPIARVFAAVAKLEYLAVNTVNTLISIKDLSCVGYLSVRAGQIAFDSQVPGEDCKYMNSSNPSWEGNKNAAMQARHLPHPMKEAWMQQSQTYQSTLTDLVNASQSANPQQFSESLKRFGSAETALGNQMNQNNILAGAADNQVESLVDFYNSDKKFSLSNMNIYLSAVDQLTSWSQGSKTETAFSEMAQAARRELDSYQKSLQYIDLNPATDVVVASFLDVKLDLSTRTPTIQGQVVNLGKQMARQLSISVTDGERELIAVNLGEVAPGKTLPFNTEIRPRVDQKILGIYLKVNGEVMDYRTIQFYEQPIPTTITPTYPPTLIPTQPSRTVTPATVITRTPTPRPTPTPSSDSTLQWVVGVIGGSLALGSLAFYLIQRRKRL